MKRITISLPEDLVAALERESRRERASVSEIARKAIEERLGRSPGTEKHLPFIGIGSSDGKGPYARDMEDVLREEWTIDRHRG
jgi:Arc/MetJ-type ribon-helix-helix transcriptional regulator